MISNEEEQNTYPYPVDNDDHCESPFEAYRDISLFLDRLAAESYKSKEALKIYDPYYCEGSVVQRMNSLGFFSVYNVKEDFYAKIKADDIPDYDVLVTNPPYSGDHIEKLIQFCFRSTKPWFLLLPNYVYTKSYYSSCIAAGSFVASQVFYVCPQSRYLYTTPKGRRQAKSSKFTSPFPTFWYCNMYRYTGNVLAGLNGARICRSISDLPRTIICEHDPRAKRLKNAQKRVKNKIKKKQRIAVDP